MEELKIPRMKVIADGMESTRLVDYYNRNKDGMLVAYPVLRSDEEVMFAYDDVIIIKH